jgi:hypothetical protein
MKISERTVAEDRLLHIVQKHDVSATLKRAEMMRQAQQAGVHGSIPADWIPVGVVPAVMQRVWATEAGVSMDDREAMEEVFKRKLMSGEFSKFRVDERNL